MIQTDLYSFSYKNGSVVPFCKKCGAHKYHKDGRNKYKTQIRECERCGFRFTWTSDLPRRNFFSNVIAFTIDLYSTVGISLRTISRKLKQFFGIKVSHEGIRQWVLAAEDFNFKEDKFEDAKTWHVDETYIKVKGKGFWLWVVYCFETKKVLSWHISKKRLYKDAKTVLQKALDNVNGILPEKIITDGLYQYSAAIRKTIGWNWRIQKERHIKSSGIGLNAPIEEVNREIKRRIKWFTSFQAMEGAKRFFNIYFYHFNRKSVRTRKS